MASRSLNQVLLIGNLTRDPELRYTPQGTAVCQFGLATNRDWVTSNGEKKEEVQYHRIISWSKLAELCSQLLTKGSKIFVEGRIVYRSFEGKDGTQKTVTEIVMDNMIVLGNGRAGGVAKSTESTDVTNEIDAAMTSEHGPKKSAKEEKKSVQPEADELPPELGGNEEVSEDEIPF